MADTTPKQPQITPSLVGIDPDTGGAALCIMGKVNVVSATTDDRTGQSMKLIQVEWWGGNSWMPIDVSSDLAQVMEGAKVLISQPMTTGKNGWRKNGEPKLLAKLSGAA